MKTYTSFSTKQTPQSEKIPGTDQVENSAGGFAWAVDDWTRLERFLILGAEGGTYYIRSRPLVRQNAEAVMRCIKEDGKRTVDTIVQISDEGRAPKNDPALFALAMASGIGDKETRAYALKALPKVARIGTHLFNFLTYAQQFRGWGRSLREAVAGWYVLKFPDQLAYQVVKYRQRNGWTHRDVLRKSHPKARIPVQDEIFKWIVSGQMGSLLSGTTIGAFEAAKTADAKKICKLIRDYNLPWEAIPTEHLNNIDVWDALLEKMPMTAMIRNLGKMTNIGLVKPMSDAAHHVTNYLGDKELLKRARIHPLSVLGALGIYKSGKGFRGSLTWSPVREVVDALDAAFYECFDNVRPTGKRLMLAMDVSGSMDWGEISGMPGVSPRVGAAAMGLVTANVESQYMTGVFETSFHEHTLSPRQRLDDVIRDFQRMTFGGTDCALPMAYALNKEIPIDAFIIYTDNETWAGDFHPVQSLEIYRNKMGIPAKLVVVGMTSENFTIADPNDGGSLDVVGFDTATPNVISDFIGG